jgi:hypothetical protein
MMRRLAAALGAGAVAALFVGCAAPVPSDSSSVEPTASATPSAPSPSPTGSAQPDAIVGTVVRFTSDRTTVDVTVGEDSPAVRDFLSMLPLSLPFEDLSGREKIAYLPRELNIEGSPGSDPENGDLIYFTSWGNLGFYYNAEGIEYSDATLHIGTYDATADQLALLEGGMVTIEVIE